VSPASVSVSLASTPVTALVLSTMSSVAAPVSATATGASSPPVIVNVSVVLLVAPAASRIV
jgi:hypothetical protein